MDLVSAVVSSQQAQLASKIQFAVAKKVLDNDRMQGAAAIKLIEAATMNASTASDSLAAAATGLGSQIDVFA